ncbi:hypothetical protein L843_3386 [Mycobacterium intracellulare MIN_061107_1834]|nr:hypothetical protein L843_3386 [Mycobacterium intracellulare MIN_061107_1834]
MYETIRPPVRDGRNTIMMNRFRLRRTRYVPMLWLPPWHQG